MAAAIEMTYWDWRTVHHCMQKYGLRCPIVDVGGVLNTSISDYHGESGIAGLIRPTTGHIWSAFSHDVDVTHDAETYAQSHTNYYATVISTGTLEHTDKPWEFFAAAADMLQLGGLLCLTAPFMWPTHGDEHLDRWRFSQYGLAMLCELCGLEVQETGQESVVDQRWMAYVVASKGPVALRDRFDQTMPEVIAT